ncbi:phosphotransferase [Pseudomonas sp. NFACC13-1]|uniref:phosphotransferase n=1 Tax=Pseudomonas sp. NFACC13-1 TaxID=1566245 RepID=UPI000882499D|nr:phosphotransferase [Pseudomonas sp. NFACC13-1]SDB67584.1 Ser/Thr protein kinase RdoA involved in Cpx stress response, MazF antagonist [Pseudomonas sp. NFACC13-1]
MSEIHQAMSLSENDSLTKVAAEVSVQEAVEVAQLYFGVSGTASRLISERDQNFRLTCMNGSYVLKFAHPGEDSEVSNLQTEALLHIEHADPTLPVQRVIRTKDGQAELRLMMGGEERTVRLVSYLEGQLLRNAPVTLQQQRNLGVVSARLGKALRDFDHPAANHTLVWDIQHADRLSGMVTEISNLERRALLDNILDRFVRDIKPRYASMRTQIVHNDLNSDNALVSPENTDEVVAILDFGDMVRTPLINDVAVGAAYQLGELKHFLDGAKAFVAGYHSVTPLKLDEFALMYDLIMTRMVVRITISEWRAERFPENAAYILRNTSRAWQQLQALVLMDKEEVNAQFIRACQYKS